MPANHRIQFTVALQPQDPRELASAAAEVATPASPRFRHYLTAAQFAHGFGATQLQIEAVRSVLTSDGLAVGAPAANHLTLPVTGSAAQIEQAFSISLSQVKLATGRTAYANSQAPAIAASITGFVQGVIGLSDVALDQPRQVRASLGALRPPGRSILPAARPSAVGPQIVTGPEACTQVRKQSEEEYLEVAAGLRRGFGYTAGEFQRRDGLTELYSQGDLGVGQAVALVELEPYQPSDIATYQACYGTNTPITNIEVDGGSPPYSGEDGESALDIEQLVGLAPKAKVLVYQGPDKRPTTAVDILSTIVSQDAAKVISSSWGACEPETAESVLAAENTLLEEAAIQGQSFFSSSGDFGSQDCAERGGNHSLAVDDPAGQPFATGVGGTTLEVNSETTPAIESVWNEGAEGASGGGLSAHWAMPRYQLSAAGALGVINSNSSPTPCGQPPYCREVPDVSAPADPRTGYLTFREGRWSPAGGTSAAAPLWAAFAVLTNASAACRGIPIGFANPSLYSIASSGSYPNDFNDVTAANIFTGFANNNLQGAGLFPVLSGYDMATGLGSPAGFSLSGPTLARSLCAMDPNKANAEVERTKHQEEEAARKHQEEAAARKHEQEEAARKHQEEEANLSARMTTLLAGQLIPSGKGARIATLLKRGGFTVNFTALEAGTAEIMWYYLPRGATLAKTRAKPFLLAAGRLTFLAAAIARIKLKLTPKGKHLLDHTRRIKLTAKGTFTPPSKPPITALKTFVLKR